MTYPERLYGGMPPHVSGSTTSREAAHRIESVANTLRGQVFRAICAEPGTDEELQNRLAMRPNTQRPRRVELVALDLVVDSGKTRAGVSGRSATVWQQR